MSAQRAVRRPAWLNRELTIERGLTLALLLAALNSVALGLTTIIRGLDAGLLLPLANLGVLVGWALAASPWSGGSGGAIITVAGGLTLVMRVGRLDEAILLILWRLLVLAWQIVRWPVEGPPDVAPLQLTLAAFWTGMAVLLGRLWDWLFGLVQAEPAFDPVATALLWGLVLWSTAAWAGWLVRRKDRPLAGLLPAGALLVTTLAYGTGNFTYLLLLVGLTWLLLALVGQAARERRWQAAGIDFAVDIRADVAIVTVWVAAALVALAQITPFISLQPVAEATQRLIWGQPLAAGPVAHSLGLQPQAGQPSAFDRVRRGGLPRRHLLGSGPELSQQVALIVYPVAETETRNYYWRSLTYDRYTGLGWLTGKTETSPYRAGESVKQSLEISPTSAVLLTQKVQIIGSLEGLLYSAGVLLSVDQPYEVAWRKPGDVFGATIAATSYQVVSMLPEATEVELRLAGNRYPPWVRQRYLALPREVPGRVLALARNLTATQPTPYERARAIEAYLRTLPYDLNLPAPPINGDVVDYFLFDLQRGYCDYYATAMVVLARAAGIPARLVIGYAGGTFDPAEGRYLVTEANAHAWAELYFPGYGWIEFEPTAVRPLLERSAEPIIPAAAAPEIALPQLTTSHPGGSLRWGWGVVAAVAGLALSGVLWSSADVWRLSHLSPAVVVTSLYQRMQRYGSRLAVPISAGATPYEFSTALSGLMNDQAATKSRWVVLLAPAAPEIERLTELYVNTVYSTQRLTPAERRQAIQIWQRLRWRLWLVWARLEIKGLNNLLSI